MSIVATGGHLRAWLKLTLFYVAVIAGMAGLMLAVAALKLRHPIVTIEDFTYAKVDPGFLALVGLLPLIPTVPVTLLARRFLDGKSPLTSLGLAWRRLPAGLGGGFALGVGFLALNVGLIAALGGAKPSFAGITGSGWRLLANEAAFFLTFAALEEFWFRGYPLRVLDESWRRWGAIISTSIVFALLHLANPISNPLPLVNVAGAGVILALLYLQSGSLWLAIGFHWGWNFAEGPVFGTAVSGMATNTTIFKTAAAGPIWLSGGGFGPEASVVLTVTAAAAIATIIAVKPFGRRPGAAAPGAEL